MGGFLKVNFNELRLFDSTVGLFVLLEKFWSKISMRFITRSPEQKGNTTHIQRHTA